MRKQLVVGLLLSSFVMNQAKSQNEMNNTLSDQEKSSGWQLLFDGKSTAGWHKYGHQPDL